MSATVTTTITELPESRVRVQAEVAPTEVERRMQQAARKLGNNLRVPGFRKGKVPPPVVIRRLGREYVLDEAMRDALGSWYLDAVDTSGIVPVGEPSINFGDLPEQGAPVTFTIEIGVRPVAKLGDYKGIEIERRAPEPDAEAIDAEIERMRDRLATLETVDRPAQLGDHVVVDYVGRLEDGPFAGGEGRDQLLELGADRLVPGFEEQLIGVRAGEERIVEVTFPEQYAAEQLAGRPATFEVKVSEVKVKRLPELNDEFASDAGGFDTLTELREDVAMRLREREQHNIEHEFERDVVDAVAAAATIEIPQKLVHARAHELVEETLSSLARQGISKETYLKVAGRDEEQMAHEAETEADLSLRREAAIAAVVAAESVEVSDADILEALQPSAERAKTTPQALLDELAKNGRLARLRSDLAERKAVEWLVEHARPVSPGTTPTPAKPSEKKTATKKPPAKKSPEPAAAAQKPAPKRGRATTAAAKKPAAKKPPVKPAE